MFQFVVLLRAFCASVSNDRPPIWPVTIFSAARKSDFALPRHPLWCAGDQIGAAAGKSPFFVAKL
jgi:hypothetical protein